MNIFLTIQHCVDVLGSEQKTTSISRFKNQNAETQDIVFWTNTTWRSRLVTRHRYHARAGSGRTRIDPGFEEAGGTEDMEGMFCFMEWAYSSLAFPLLSRHSYLFESCKHITGRELGWGSHCWTYIFIFSRCCATNPRGHAIWQRPIGLCNSPLSSLLFKHVKWHIWVEIVSYLRYNWAALLPVSWL